MKKNLPPHILLLLLCLLSALNAQSQKAKNPSDILNQTTQEVPSVDTSGFGLYEIAIRFPYGSARILNPEAYAAIKSYGKIAVEYIYTKYTQSQPGQKELDRDRFAALQRLAPDLFKDPGIRWDIIVQTEATTPEEARGLFHGFVIRYQPPVSEERKEEIKTELDDLVDCAKKRPPADAPKYPGGPDALKLWLESNLKFPKDEIKTKGAAKVALVEFFIDTLTGKPLNVKVSKVTSAKLTEHIKTVVESLSGWQPGNPDIIFTMLIGFKIGDDGKPKIDCQPLRGYNIRKCNGLKSDSLIMKVMDRNKNWKKMLVVEDVTGSMMPYIADLLLWNALKGNLQNTSHFVFFNDGDSKTTEDKVIGSTGGLYHAKPQNVDVLEETMIKAIAGGNGDDTPENDIEAVLEGIKSCPDCDEVILIADNDATPRDLELVPKITKPVHVILCGVRYAPNPAHLYIAWKTKGSLHTIREDITKLADMQEGESITVMGKSFKILNGKFVATSKM